MDMTVVLGIFTFIFFATLSLMCFYRSKINVKLFNRVFIIADLIAYSCWNYAGYQVGWLNTGWMTLNNISPLMFTLILLVPFMKEKVRDYVYSTIACLSLGMFMAMLISPEHDYIFNFNTEATFLYTSEAVCHLVCSLYGFYLVLSTQVEANIKQWTKGVVCLLSIITLGVVCNFVFHRNYFGMDPYGNAQIYMIDLFDGFWPTLIAYYFGVLLILTMGMQTVYVLDRATAHFFDHEEVEISKDEREECADSVHCNSVNLQDDVIEIDPENAQDIEEILLSVNVVDELAESTHVDANLDVDQNVNAKSDEIK